MAKSPVIVPPAPANNASSNLSLGASGTNANQLGGGALQNILNNPGQVAALGRALQPQKRSMGDYLTEDDRWLVAFKFFTDMAAKASEPGATLLGAGGDAGSAAVDFATGIAKQKRAEDLAATQLGAGLIGKLSKTPTFKQYPTGETLTYRTKEGAEKYLEQKGLSRNSPVFESTVKRLTAPTESMVGKPVVIADSFQQLAPMVRGNTIVGFNFTPVTGVKPGSVIYRDKRIPIIAKNNNVIDQTFKTLPVVQEAMDLLLTGEVKTGGLAELTLPIKNIFGQLFGIEFPDVQNLQIIQSISNFLAPQMRPPGSGSTSDMEFTAYQRSIAALGNTPEANYISLYTFMKRAQNAIEANQKEIEILSDGGSAKDVNEAVRKIDPGIYETYKGSMDDRGEFNDWVKSLPRGAVIYNRDPDGKKLFDDDNRIFIIKGFGTPK
tara:strand:- start:127 stop:1437 length:1311 start_codon:yes stop_codon:yes gene_type:complete